MAKKNRKKGEQKIIKELLSQLVLQGERWGLKDYYTQLKLEEMRLDICHEIQGELLTEKSNLEYELHTVGTNKRDALIKIERLNSYIQKAKRLTNQHQSKITAILEKSIPDKDQLALALKRVKAGSSVSVMINNN